MHPEFSVFLFITFSQKKRIFNSFLKTQNWGIWSLSTFRAPTACLLQFYYHFHSPFWSLLLSPSSWYDSPRPGDQRKIMGLGWNEGDWQRINKRKKKKNKGKKRAVCIRRICWTTVTGTLPIPIFSIEDWRILLSYCYRNKKKIMFLLHFGSSLLPGCQDQFYFIFSFLPYILHIYQSYL